MNWIEKATRRLKTQAAIAEVASIRLRQAGDYGNAEDWIRMSRELYNIINLLTAPIGQQGEPVGWWMVRNKSDGFVFFVRNDDETWGERARKPYPHDGFEYTAVVCQNLPNREREALELLARAVNYVRTIYSDHPDPSWAEEADHILSEGGEG